MTVVLGVDLGGSKVEAIALEGDNTLDYSVAPTRSGSGEAVLDCIVETVGRLTSQIEQPASALGLGMPGIVDTRLGTVRNAVNLGIVEPYAIAANLSERLDGLPVKVENDVRLGAIGAQQYLGDTSGSLAYVGIGTGIAAGIMIGGELHRGATDMAGEIGHINFINRTHICHCGLVGCLEAEASGPAIAARWPGGSQSARDLFDRALAGQPDAVPVADPIIAHLARAIETLVRLIDPSKVVLAGGVGTSTPALRSLLVDKFRQATHNVLLNEEDLEARLLQLPPDWPAGARGAATIAKPKNQSQGRTE